MNTIQVAYINALLADASYVTGIKKGGIPTNDKDFTKRLTQTQANFLAANFKVIDSVETYNPNKPGDPPGFDAVVWEGKSGTPYAGQLYVSMRGTDGKTDVSDDIDLVATGIPRNQIIAMVNWWMRISTPTGQKNAAQIQYGPVKVGVDEDGKDIFDDQFTAAPSVNGEGLVNNRIISGVNGHSLGGYLSTAFTRLFGSNALSVNTFNSAGFSNVSTENIRKNYDQISQLVGTHLGTGSLDAVASRQTNFYAENGWNFTTNAAGEMGFLVPGFYQYGSQNLLYQDVASNTKVLVGAGSTSATGKRLPGKSDEQKRPLTHAFIGLIAMGLHTPNHASCKPTKARAMNREQTCFRGIFNHKSNPARLGGMGRLV